MLQLKSNLKKWTRLAEISPEAILLVKNKIIFSNFEQESLILSKIENMGKVPSWERGRLGELTYLLSFSKIRPSGWDPCTLHKT